MDGIRVLVKVADGRRFHFCCALPWWVGGEVFVFVLFLKLELGLAGYGGRSRVIALARDGCGTNRKATSWQGEKGLVV